MARCPREQEWPSNPNRPPANRWISTSSSSAPARRVLPAAIRLKQLNADISVVIVEKGSEVGAHILSGAVIDPIGLDRLIPDWRDRP